MSLLNPTNAAYISSQPIDKIVRVFTGTYNPTTDLTARVADFGTIYVYRIAHGLPRPVTCEMIFSTDGGVTYEDGGISKLAFSDSTYVYIFHGHSAVGANVTYKVWCSWIDNYDTSNPLITTQSYTSLPTQFDSRVNFQKIEDQNVLTFTPGTFGSTETKTVVHTLGYTPNAKVYFEAFDGEVWPLNSGGASNIFQYASQQDQCRLYIYSDRIEVIMDKFSNESHRAWYRIYYDANTA